MLFEIVAVLPILLWAALTVVLPHGPFHMDQGEHKGSFFPLLILYMTIGFFVAIASLVFSAYYSGVEDQFFLIAAIEALLFNTSMLFFYEGYLHSMAATGKSNYGLVKYALVMALGISCLLTFIAGLVTVAL